MFSSDHFHLPIHNASKSGPTRILYFLVKQTGPMLQVTPMFVACSILKKGFGENIQNSSGYFIVSTNK